MYLPASEASSSSGPASSSASAQRPSGTLLTVSWLVPGSDHSRRVSLVRTQPGARQLTRTPSGAASTARVRVMPISPALAAPYTPMPGLAERPATLATLTIAPPRGPARQEGAAQVEVHDLVPPGGAGVRQGGEELLAAGDVDEHVELAGALRRPRHQRFDRGLVGGVGRRHHCLGGAGPARRGRDPLEVAGGAGGEHQARTRLRAGQGGLLADAPARPDDQDGPAVQAEPRLQRHGVSRPSSSSSARGPARAWRSGAPSRAGASGGAAPGCPRATPPRAACAGRSPGRSRGSGRS